MTARPHLRNARAQAEADETRERRLAECRSAVEEFVFGLGRLMAGHESQLEHCATRGLVHRIRDALEPFLDSGEALRPDFGSHGELRVDGDLLDVAAPLRAWIEFEDRSMLQSRGRLVPVPRRRVRMQLMLSVQPCRVIDLAVTCGAVS